MIYARLKLILLKEQDIDIPNLNKANRISLNIKFHYKSIIFILYLLYIYIYEKNC